MGTRVTIRPTGKRVFFHELGNIIMKIIYAPQYKLRKISNTCQRYTQTSRRRNEGKKGTSNVMRCCVIPMQFHFITYGMELYTNDSITINTNIEQCMCMRASGASELRKFWHFYIFLNCYFFQYFVVTLTGKSLVYHGKILCGVYVGPPPPTSTPVLMTY